MNKLNNDFLRIEDFVWDENFRKWVLNDNDPLLAAYWGNWLDQHPERRDIFFTAKDIVKAIAVKNPQVSDDEISLAIQQIMQKVNEPATTATHHKTKTINWFKYIGIAASFLLIATAALYFTGYLKSQKSQSYKELAAASGNEFIEKINKGDNALAVNMPDGSKVILEKNAKISFAKNFDSQAKRTVYLNGKATFDVAKNPEKPFFVYTNKFITKVLGTKFTITATEGDTHSDIQVISGVVAVYPVSDKAKTDADRQNSLVLTRNQKATYFENNKILTAAIVDHPLALQERIFDKPFYDVPLARIFKNIEDSYGIELIYDEKLLANRTFTADLNKTTLYEKLDIICKVINARYETIDGKIVFYANPVADN